jgi:putative transposase
MSQYRRAYRPGGTFFLTHVSHKRVHIWNTDAARLCLREAISAARARRPFELLQSVLLPDHLHLIVRLAPDDADFSIRIASLKAEFTRRWLADSINTETQGTPSRRRQRYRGVWQKRFWEHTVRDEQDLARCEEYLWFNPVKHGLAKCPHSWQWSSFHREVKVGRMPVEWCCACDGRSVQVPEAITGAEAEEMVGE